LLLAIVTIPCRAERELIIVSPHWEGIQYEFGRAFEEHYKTATGEAVRVRWRDMGGTSQIEKALDASYQANPETSGIDLFFGGGIDPFESQKTKGHLVAYKLPDALLAGVPATLGGFPIVDPDYQFYGAALSSFGILKNLPVARNLGLPPVETWEDLCRPELATWVSSADPRKSGSVHMIYEIILQAYGWEKGWQVIHRMGGNVRAFEQSSSGPTKQVSIGDAAYAVSIDINGMTQQAFLGKENVRFSIPRGVSVINPDGIAILKGAPNLDVAQAFVDFTLSPRGQSLWMIPKGQPGGPVKFDISRMGVLPSFYQGDLSRLLVPLNPFTESGGFRYNSPLGSKRWNLVNALIGQTVIDVHPRLAAAWHALHQLSEADRAPLLAEFDKPFVGEEEALALAPLWKTDKIRALRLSNQWMQEADARYERLAQQALALAASPLASNP
jgi:ABC-type Fe3+ transport system substrate-binding protein